MSGVASTPPCVFSEEARWIPTSMTVSVPFAGTLDVEMTSSSPLAPSWSCQAVAKGGTVLVEHRSDEYARIRIVIEEQHLPALLQLSVWVKRHSPQPRIPFRVTVTPATRTGRNLSPSKSSRPRSPQHVAPQVVSLQAQVQAKLQRIIHALLRKVLSSIDFVFRESEDEASQRGKSDKLVLYTHTGVLLYAVLDLCRFARLLSRSSVSLLTASANFATAVRASGSAISLGRLSGKGGDLMREHGRALVCEAENLVAADRASKLVDTNNKILKCQRLAKAWIAWRRVAKIAEVFAENDRSERKRIVTEICESESVYLAALTALHAHFYTPLSASCSSIGLSERDVARIFGNLKALISLSTEIRSVLQNGMDAWPAIQRVGALFVRLAPTLKIFAQYAADYSVSKSTLNEARSRVPILPDLLRSFAAKAGSALSIEDYLIMPVQRMPRYELLLTSLLAATPPRHPDYAALKDALQQVKGINKFVDSKRGEREAAQKLAALAAKLPSISAAVFAPTRTALLTSSVLVSLAPVSAPTTVKLKPRDLFLMSDCIVLISPRKLHHLWLFSTLHDVEPLDQKDEASKHNFGIRFLTAPSHEPARVCVLFWVRSGERQEWLALVRSAKARVN